MMMIKSRTVAAVMLFTATASAFTTIIPPKPIGSTTTVLNMKFMKDLGFEKPSWLPDFGAKKEEEETKEGQSSSPTAEATDKEEAEAVKEE
jgi:hypothetical protein